MYIKETNGITLIALVITIILLLILGGVVVSQLNSGNLIGNAISVIPLVSLMYIFSFPPFSIKIYLPTS